MAARQAPQPSAWDASIRSPAQRYLSIEGCRVKYVGPGTDDRDAAAVRANHPVPLDCPLFYFEVEVISRGRDGYIGIGFSSAEVKLDRLPGWEPHSYGYHGDDGHAFSGRGTGRAYGPTYTTGDWVGVVLNRIDGTISFCKKGYDLGVAFSGVGPDERLYPAVGFRTPDEEIVANFGTDLATRPFRGDPSALRAEAQQRLYARVLATTTLPPPLPPPPSSGSGTSKGGALSTSARSGSSSSSAKGAQPNVLGELVFGYLKNHGHWETAAAVARDVLGGAVAVSEQDVRELEARRQLSASVAAGDVDAALALAEQLAPGVLAADPRIHFRLQCQKFAEMIRAGQAGEAIEYARSHVVPLLSATQLPPPQQQHPEPASVGAPRSLSSDVRAAWPSPADRELLEDATALLAYEDASTAPTGYLLLPGHRARLAAEATNAVLMHCGRRDDSALEALYRQATVVLQELKRNGYPGAQLLDVPALLQQRRDELLLQEPPQPPQPLQLRAAGS